MVINIGKYDITLGLGDPQYAATYSPLVNGQELSTVTLRANVSEEKTLRIIVSDPGDGSGLGKLEIVGSHSKVLPSFCYLHLSPV